MWTMDSTSGFTQSELDGINQLHAKLMAEADGDEQFSKSLDDAINNAWQGEDQTWADLEAKVRDILGM